MSQASDVKAAAVAGMLLASAPLLADDQFPPPWRSPTNPETTFGEWDFGPQQGGPSGLMPGAYNPFGTPQFNPGSTQYIPGTYPGQLPSTNPTTGWWCLAPGASMTFFIPNSNEPPPHEKLVYIQILFAGAIDPSVMGSDGVTFGPSTTTTTPTPQPNGGLYQSFTYRRPGCPQFEIIELHNPSPQNNLYIHQVVIDTWCIPTPTSAALLAAGGIFASRRKR